MPEDATAADDDPGLRLELFAGRGGIGSGK